MKKAFISILGTNDYEECHHSYGSIITDRTVKYCQEDIIKIFCKDFDENSEIRIFLTDAAEKTNWLDNGHIDRKTNIPKPNKGLKARLEELKLKSKKTGIPIKEGYTENEIWEIFQKIYDSFRDEEEVIVDITHSFRSLPMLMITLLNYAKQVKKIKVAGIYYAAFESLGTLAQAKELPIERRIVPILNLTPFSELQDWTNSTFDFVNNANLAGIKNLVKIADLNSPLKNSAEKFFPTNVLRKLDDLISSIALCRGKELLNYDFIDLNRDIENLKNRELPKPFVYLIEEIQTKISTFKNDLKVLTLSLAEWCLIHNLIQQAITLLQEFSISIILKEKELDISAENNRTIVSQAFRIKAEDIPSEKWRKPASDNEKMVKKILELDLLKNLTNDFNSLTAIRNDVNHAGFLDSASSVCSIKSKLNNILDSYKKYLT